MACSPLDRIGRIAAFAAALPLASITALSAQVTGVVLDPAGMPVPEATVVLWKGEREVARSITDPAGSFRFGPDVSTAASILLVRRIGFRPTSVTLTSQRSALSVRLEPLAAALPEVVTTAARRACPSRDEPEARRLWHAMSERYATHPRNDGAWAIMFWSRGDAAGPEVGEIDESRLPPGEYAVAGDLRENYYRSIARDGYARRLKPGEDLSGQFLHWRYLPIHRELSEHLVESDFAKRHTLGLWHTDDGAYTITFCGRDHSRPYLEGTLTISPDSALRAARWQFRTPSPRENAGAEVTFLTPPRGAAIWFLVPLRSVFWRRIGGPETLYFQEASVYRKWLIGPNVVRIDHSGRLTTQRP